MSKESDYTSDDTSIDTNETIEINDNNSGYVYIIQNEAHKIYGSNVYKVGKTKDMKKRMNGYITGFIRDTNLLYCSEICINYNLAELMTHNVLKDHQLVCNREFFYIDDLDCIRLSINNIINNIKLKK